MVDIIEELVTLASQKDNDSKAKILLMKDQLVQILKLPPDSSNPALSPRQFLLDQKLLPEVVLLTKLVNNMLLEKLQGRSCSLKQESICAQWRATYPNIELKYAYLDAMERCFQDAGWKVVYDKPGYSESYDAYFTFSIK